MIASAESKCGILSTELPRSELKSKGSTGSWCHQCRRKCWCYYQLYGSRCTRFVPGCCVKASYATASAIRHMKNWRRLCIAKRCLLVGRLYFALLLVRFLGYSDSDLYPTEDWPAGSDLGCQHIPHRVHNLYLARTVG